MKLKFSLKFPWQRLRPLVGLVSVAFLVVIIWRHGNQVLDLAPDQQGWALLLFAVAATVAAQWLNGLAWWALLRWLRSPLPWHQVLLLFVRTNIYKYLPGGVWHQVGRLRWLRAERISPRRALLAVVLEPLLMLIAALALLPLGGMQWGLGLIAPLALLLMRPRWLNPLLERILRSKGAEAELATPEQNLLGSPWQPLLMELPFLLFRFTGFAFCVASFSSIQSLGLGLWLAAFALAWAVGLVVPGAPGGIGVFELVMLTRLRGLVPEPELLAVLISYRLISVVAELIAAAAAQFDQGDAACSQ
jgi:uncharacterized membrane protein YbhN (UPF0104 family)